jgi:hypothetical protein
VKTPTKLGWDVLLHLHYSAVWYLVTSHLFAVLKKHFGGKNYRLNDAGKNVVFIWAFQPQRYFLFGELGADAVG